MKLAKEVLGELPGQVVDFFMSRNIEPMPAKEADRQQLMSQLSMRQNNTGVAKLDAAMDAKKELLIQQC